MVDFKGLKKPVAKKQSSDPLKIFERRPSLPETPNDLWRGQSEALKDWHDARDKSDVLISLNTGAGKTLVGLLIAQSLVNEGVENVVYACCTIDLIRQTVREAHKIGLKPTVRAQGKFFDSNFESGSTFCVTTYNAVFTSLSPFRKRHFPGAIIFDDAHVAEKVLRDCFTLTVRRADSPELFIELLEVIDSIAKEENRTSRFEDILSGRFNDLYFCHPSLIYKYGNTIRSVIKKHNPKDKKFYLQYIYLIDHIEKCMIIVSGDSIEISPPFIPIFSMPFFSDNSVRRIYLSATLNHKADFVRAFGRVPKVEIEPENDAGNGERLVLFADEGMKPAESQVAVSQLAIKHKVLVAVPNYRKASEWTELAEPPKLEDFSSKLDEFRSQSEKGCFLLVSRVDGIDLPENTCRVMIVDGLPTGFSLAERYQLEFLRMQNYLGAKLANRVTQLFGRINRGRNDYGVFIILSRDARNWLRNTRNLYLLPDLLHWQVKLGSHLIENGITFNTKVEIFDTIDKVLDRDSDWIDFYRDSIEALEEEEFDLPRFYEQEEQITKAAISGVRFQSHLWDNDFSEAKAKLIEGLDEITLADGRLGGWHYLWLGLVSELQENTDDATEYYRKAVYRLTKELSTPPIARIARPKGEEHISSSAFEDKLIPFVNLRTDDIFAKDIAKLNKNISDLSSGKTNLQEEVVRLFGEEMAYEATRPDNEFNIGPDVLWLDHANKCALAFELKTDKTSPAKYTKKEVGQGHNHLEWVSEQHPGYTVHGLIFIGPKGKCDPAASPSKDMFHCDLAAFIEFSKTFVAFIEDARKQKGTNRGTMISSAWRSGRWELTALRRRLASSRMSQLDESS